MVDSIDAVDDKRTPKEIAIDELANGASVVNAAKAAGVTRKTVFQWKAKDADFQRQLATETALRTGRLAAVMSGLDERMIIAVNDEIHKRLHEMDNDDLVKLHKNTSGSINARIPQMKLTESHTTSTKDEWKTAGAVLTSQSGVIDLEPVGEQPTDDVDDE